MLLGTCSQKILLKIRTGEKVDWLISGGLNESISDRKDLSPKLYMQKQKGLV